MILIRSCEQCGKKLGTVWLTVFDEVLCLECGAYEEVIVKKEDEGKEEAA
jgi:hypothetical protein